MNSREGAGVSVCVVLRFQNVQYFFFACLGF